MRLMYGHGLLWEKRVSPFEYMFSDADGLERLTLRRVKAISIDATPWDGLLSVDPENSIAFEGPPDLQQWAFYRHCEEGLQIVSPFGCCQLPHEGLDFGAPVGFVNAQCDGGGASSWDAQIDSQWRDESGEVARKFALKARPEADGCFEPLHMSIVLRGMSGKEMWSVVLLPAPADRVYARDGGARIDSGGRVFALPPGRAAEDVLAGQVQWGLPDANGFFVLQKR